MSAAAESPLLNELRLTEPMREQFVLKEKQFELRLEKESPEPTTIWLKKGLKEKPEIDGTLAVTSNAPAVPVIQMTCRMLHEH